jgi:hypothetical protein
LADLMYRSLAATAAAASHGLAMSAQLMPEAGNKGPPTGKYQTLDPEIVRRPVRFYFRIENIDQTG